MVTSFTKKWDWSALALKKILWPVTPQGQNQRKYNHDLMWTCPKENTGMRKFFLSLSDWGNLGCPWHCNAGYFWRQPSLAAVSHQERCHSVIAGYWTGGIGNWWGDGIATRVQVTGGKQGALEGNEIQNQQNHSALPRAQWKPLRKNPSEYFFFLHLGPVLGLIS